MVAACSDGRSLLGLIGCHSAYCRNATATTHSFEGAGLLRRTEERRISAIATCDDHVFSRASRCTLPKMHECFLSESGMIFSPREIRSASGNCYSSQPVSGRSLDESRIAETRRIGSRNICKSDRWGRASPGYRAVYAPLPPKQCAGSRRGRCCNPPRDNGARRSSERP
jgi:hypothetical protein